MLVVVWLCYDRSLLRSFLAAIGTGPRNRAPGRAGGGGVRGVSQRLSSSKERKSASLAVDNRINQ